MSRQPQSVYRKRYRVKLRGQILEAYGGMCLCCGETEPSFLAVDHVGGGGSKHRKEHPGGEGVLLWLRKQGFPKGFRLLCHNCNFAEHFVEGGCPHRLQRGGSRLLYAAGPIDDIPGIDSKGWREQLMTLLPDHVAVYSPAHAFLGASWETASVIDTANRRMLVLSDGVIAYFGGAGRGFGTAREIEMATRLGKPVAVVGSLESLLTHDLYRASTLDDAVYWMADKV